jgi:diaminohydroxyphosphoribosylaminopyrimidine deaminase/5-amino-6-(5-phosphoribosylamino)uracil reductase
LTEATAADRRWLDAVARTATVSLGARSSEPSVGAFLVDPLTQHLLGRATAGPAEAGPLAVADAADVAAGATLYLTLAPTLAAAEAIAAGGVTRLIIGAGRLAPEVTARLALESVEVVSLEHAGSLRWHEGDLGRIERGRPFVTVTLAISADGMVGISGQRRVPTLGELAQRWLQVQRAEADAVMIGWGTARLDDPELGVAIEGLEHRAPMRVVVAGLRMQDTNLTLFRNADSQPTKIIAILEKKLEPPPNVELIRVKGLRGRPDITSALDALAQRGVGRLLVETGPTLLESLLAGGLIDRFHLLRNEAVIGAPGVPAAGRGGIEARIGAAGLSLVDHRLLGADNLRTFERMA